LHPRAGLCGALVTTIYLPIGAFSRPFSIARRIARKSRRPLRAIRRTDNEGTGLYCASTGASVGSGLGGGLLAGAAGGVAAVDLRAVVRFGAARLLVGLPRRTTAGRRLAAVLRFVADRRLPAFLVLVAFAFAFRVVLAMTSLACSV